MKILVIGSGGREHTLCWKIARSPLVEKIFCAPGNAGTAQVAENIDIGADDIMALADFARDNSIDLTIIGPEGPLVNGLADLLFERGLKAFGPKKAAAQLEGSKSFTKQICEKYGVPTGQSESFTEYEKALASLNRFGFPVVLKADGLAAGKGVLICENLDEAKAALKSIMLDRDFGGAGDSVLVEEFLHGEEASFLAFCDGKTVMPLATCQDHKRVFDGDKGLNTGGMGAYSPAPVVTPALFDDIMTGIMKPIVAGMADQGAPYQGVLYAGLMIENGAVKVLEFNARFGDPETQPLLFRMKSDIVPLLMACADGTLHEHSVEWLPEPSVCVVMASGGYPGAYVKGKVITGLDSDFGQNAEVFHAGTKLDGDNVVTSGGRVLGVTALGAGIPEAIANAYAAVDKISFEGAHCRTDIGAKAKRHL
jgi:phosphoribosylamine---glycine ligase